MMWVFVALASIELVVVHLMVLLLWSGVAAAVLSLATLAGIAWLVVAIASMPRLPVLLDAEALLMRVGTISAVRVPLAAVAGWEDGPVKGATMLNLALIAHPNTVVMLREPLPGRRGITAVAHRLDDPQAFRRALDAACGAVNGALDPRAPGGALP